MLTVVVLDACDDGSERLAGQFGPDVHFVSVDAGNVGAARAAGFEYARSQCADVEPARTWYATTDADSVVDAEWLLRMTATDADMVLGVVRVPAWRHFPPRSRAGTCAAITRKARATTTFTAPTWVSAPTPTGVSAASARWPPVRTSSWSSGSRPPDMRIHRDAKLSVATSDRRDGRAPGGFAQHLRGLSARCGATRPRQRT